MRAPAHAAPAVSPWCVCVCVVPVAGPGSDAGCFVYAVTRNIVFSDSDWKTSQKLPDVRTRNLPSIIICCTAGASIEILQPCRITNMALMMVSIIELLFVGRN